MSLEQCSATSQANSSSTSGVLNVVIVTWNSSREIERCLDSLIRQVPAERVVVVDNASSDGTTDLVARRFPDVHLIVNPENLGFAAACNQGISHTGSGPVMLLNPDSEVKEGAVARLVRTLEDDSRVGAVGPLLLDASNRPRESCFRAPTLRRELWRLLLLDAVVPVSRYSLGRTPPSTPRSVDVIEGACLLLSRRALGDVGPLDEGFFVYNEEFDFCTRLRAAGYRVLFEPRAQVMHLQGASTSQMRTEMFVELYRGRVRYFAKHGGRLKAALYQVLLLKLALARLLLLPVALLSTGDRRARLFGVVGRYLRLAVTLPFPIRVDLAAQEPGRARSSHTSR